MLDYLINHDIMFAILLVILSCIIYSCVIFCNIFTPKMKLYLSSLAYFFIGLSFLILGVVLKGHPVRSSLYLAISSILIFSVAYTAYTEYRLSKLILIKIESLINNKIPINIDITNYGLSGIKIYNQSDLHKKINSSQTCKYIVLYSLDFFKKYYEDLSEFAASNEIEIIMTNPNHVTTINALEDSFEPRAEGELKQHIEESKKYVCEQICKNGDNAKHVKIGFINRVLTYSSYIFNDNELWLCPRQSTKSKKDGIVFIFNDKLDTNFYYKDSLKVIKDALIQCDKCQYVKKES